MLETRDEETGEIIKTLIDKVKRRKVTQLKKAILKSRKPKEQDSDCSFVTIESGDEKEIE